MKFTNLVCSVAFASLVIVAPEGASAQRLSEQQTSGRQVFAQSCGVCHLPPVMNAKTYGPPLSKETAGGNAEIIRTIITEGGPRMPAFKHYLEGSQMDAVISYLSTVPPAAPATTR